MLGLALNHSNNLRGIPSTGMLDNFAGSSCALSLRKIVGAYYGALIRVRRSSDNATLDIFANSQGVLDTSTLLSFCGAGDGFVERWYSQVGGFYAGQTTLASQPKIVSSGVLITSNTKPYLSFDGADDYLTFSSAVAASTENGYSLVIENAFDITNRCLISSATGGLRLRWDILNRLAMLKTGTSTPVTSSPTAAGTSQHVIFASQKTTASEITVDGALSTSATAITLDQPLAEIGRDIAGTNEYCPDRISELIVFPVDINSVNIGILKNDQATFYGITVA